MTTNGETRPHPPRPLGFYTGIVTQLGHDGFLPNSFQPTILR
jgi:hypothetical protein